MLSKHAWSQRPPSDKLRAEVEIETWRSWTVWDRGPPFGGL